MATQERINDLFYYGDGALYRKKDAANQQKAGDRAGAVHHTGYRNIQIDGVMYLEHRVIYKMHYGIMPERIDHIDGNKENNRINNLRECTASQNSQNRGRQSNNTSGVKGVCWRKKSGKWHAQIMSKGVFMHLGFYTDIDAAAEAVRAARAEHHKDFARGI
jgi:hypothetical protein